MSGVRPKVKYAESPIGTAGASDLSPMSKQRCQNAISEEPGARSTVWIRFYSQQPRELVDCSKTAGATAQISRRENEDVFTGTAAKRQLPVAVVRVGFIQRQNMRYMPWGWRWSAQCQPTKQVNGVYRRKRTCRPFVTTVRFGRETAEGENAVED